MQFSKILTLAPTLLLAAASLGCGSETLTTENSGIWVICDSGDNIVYEWHHGECTTKDGGTVTGCPYPVPAKIERCYKQEEWFGSDSDSDSDSDSGEETEGISRYEWPEHGPSLFTIDKKCTKACEGFPAYPDWDDATPVCSNEWIIKGIEPDEFATPKLATELEEPGTLTCLPYFADNQVQTTPSTTTVITAGTSPQWPSDSASVALTCANFLSCSGLFDEPVMSHLVHAEWPVPGPDEAQADWSVTSSGGSLSSLTLKIHNVLSPPSQEANDVEGRIEYTVPVCGGTTCPFYLGNLTFSNDTDTWDLYSDDLLDNVHVTNINVQLRRPVLGVWRTGTNEIYLGEEKLDLRVDYDIAIGSGSPTTVVKYVTNSEEFFGQIGAGGVIEFSGLSISDGIVEAVATLDYDTVDGGPPNASFSLGSVYTPVPPQTGLLVSSITNSSTDPDSDIAFTTWLVNGTQVSPTYSIPPGAHVIRLEIRDSRLGFDYHQQSLIVN